MKRLSFLLLAVILLVSCSPASPSNMGTDELSFFNPIRTDEELNVMEGENALTNFAANYVFEPVKVINEFKSVGSTLWFDGQLLVADAVSGTIYILDKELNIIDSITEIDGQMFSPHAFATDESGKLYVGAAGVTALNTKSFSIYVLDKDFNFEKKIPFDIKSKSEILFIQGIAVNPSGGFYVTLEPSRGNLSKEIIDDGRIYLVSDDGKVTVGPGDNSYGFLLSLKGSAYFVNSGFPFLYNKDKNSNEGQAGISTLYKINGSDVTARVILPVGMTGPLTDEEAEEFDKVYAELNDGEVPQNTKEEGFYLTSTNGSGGLFRLGDDVALVLGYYAMHVFSTDLEYKYSCYLYTSFAEFYKIAKFDPRAASPMIINACADDDGNVYLITRNSGFGIKKGIKK